MRNRAKRGFSCERSDLTARVLEAHEQAARGSSKIAYGLDRLVTTAMSIPYKHKIQPHLSDTTLQEYVDYHAIYSQQRFLDDPGSAFPPPPKGLS